MTSSGFGRVLRSELTKFRTVRGWLVGLAAACLAMFLISLATAAGSHTETCNGNTCKVGGPPQVRGPGGEPVDDAFYFVHETLDGNGSITARIASLTGTVLVGPGGRNGPIPEGDLSSLRSSVQPWAKAGLIIEKTPQPGSAYAAVMATGGHGVRMQYDYTNDIPGLAGRVSPATPRWLRLVRSGPVVAAYDSSDGSHWDEIASVRIAGLPAEVEAGMFAASPQYSFVQQSAGGASSVGFAALAHGSFDEVATGGTWTSRWQGTSVDNGSGPPGSSGGWSSAGGSYLVSGAGDIAPDVQVDDGTEQGLAGSFATLLGVMVLGALFVAAEYRRRLIHTSFAAVPHRGRVLAAKAIVIGGVTFLAALVACIVTLPVFHRIWASNGNLGYPATAPTEARAIIGTALLLGLAAVLALAVGAILKRGTGAVASVVVLVVLPFILSKASVFPASVCEWLLRVTPAAAFSVQQTVPQYSQVQNSYTPGTGFFPLSPLAGIAVLAAYAAVALALATYVVGRRDA